MKRELFILISLFTLTASMTAQTVESHPDNFYTEQAQGNAKPTPFPYIPQSDIVLSTDLW